MNSVQSFYDAMADDYAFIFADWQQSVLRQADILAAFLENLGEDVPKAILDCTCGIGTQAIALATKGYSVAARDLSPKEIERAKNYAKNFALKGALSFEVVDLLQSPKHPTRYDVVLAFDNAVAHFHKDEELAQALGSMKAQLKTGGLLAISLRDYDKLREERAAHSGMTIGESAEGRRIVFQTWDWAEDGSAYQMEMFFLRQCVTGWETKSYQSHLRAWTSDELSYALVQQGFESIQWHLPDESGFYQPIVTARKV